MTSRSIAVAVLGATLACLGPATAVAQAEGGENPPPEEVSASDEGPGADAVSPSGDVGFSYEAAIAQATSEAIPGAVEPECRLSSEETTSFRAGLSPLREACLDWYHCRRVDVARVERSLLGFVVFKFWHWKRWCWKYPRVFDVTTGVYLTKVDANWHYQGIKAAWDSVYVWCCQRSDSGHVSFRQGRVDNCPFRIGCIRTVHPWVRIRAHADGSYRWSTGT